MASTSGREEDEDTLLDLMASAMISHLKGKGGHDKVGQTKVKKAPEGDAGRKRGDTGFISTKDEE